MAESPQTSDDPFRWQALFQRSRDPLFLLGNRHRRILFVNRAWEQLTGVSAGEARGLICKRQKMAASGSLEALANTLSPPADAREGHSDRIRRLVSGSGNTRRWWTIEFLPLADEQGLLGLLGKITPQGELTAGQAVPVPEKLAALRERIANRYRLDFLASEIPALQRVADQVRLAAQTNAGVLLVGEAGTGKYWLARTIHHNSISRDRTFAALDCAGIPAIALGGALFGKGGLAQQPGTGTIYLRNLAALPRDLQVQLGEWLKDPPAAPPRFIGGLTADPAQEVQQGRLLEELACVLGTLQIVLPPLRQRLADLPLLVQWFLERSNTGDRRRIAGLAPEAFEAVRSYTWPGNLEELFGVLTAAGERAKGERIEGVDLPAYLRQSVQIDQLPGRTSERPLPLDQLLEQVERRLIVLALEKARGKKSRAAELLSIWRARLLRRMKELEIADDERGASKAPESQR